MDDVKVLDTSSDQWHSPEPLPCEGDPASIAIVDECLYLCMTPLFGKWILSGPIFQLLYPVPITLLVY